MTTVYEVYEVFYRRNSKRVSKIFSSKRDAFAFRNQLKRHRRKYLGRRKVKLQEITTVSV